MQPASGGAAAHDRALRLSLAERPIPLVLVGLMGTSIHFVGPDAHDRSVVSSGVATQLRFRARSGRAQSWEVVHFAGITLRRMVRHAGESLGGLSESKQAVAPELWDAAFLRLVRGFQDCDAIG